MRSFLSATLLALALVVTGGCDSALDTEPQDILTDDQVLTNPDLIDGLMANYYSRLPNYQTLETAPYTFAATDEGVWSGSGGSNENNWGTYPFGHRGLYEGDEGYALVRDLNDLITEMESSEALDEEVRTSFAAEARFLRAYVYFEFVKRMGGVPIITEVFDYAGPDSVAALQRPRSTEAEVYDFVASELDAIMEDLPPAGTSRSRANQGSALAMKARAMLYAGSIAKYGEKTPSVSVSGESGLVNMGDADPTPYYEQALAAAEELINGGAYSLYSDNSDLQQNFYEAVISESGNPEIIFAKDYATTSESDAHLFTYETMPRSLRDDNLSSASFSPSLDLVEAYEYVDGSSGEIQTCEDPEVTGRCVANGSDYVYYENKEDAFADKDPRLWGSIMYPGSTYRGQPLALQAGVAIWDGGSYTLETGTLGSTYSGGGVLTGQDGPTDTENNASNTGFYLRKFVDTATNAGNRGQGSGVWWVYYRYAEVLLNAAEAAFELGQESTALEYINQVRERAGVAPLTALTLEDFKQERRVELAFEDHRFYDLKRWRDAHLLWDGTAESDAAVMEALFPYRVVHSGDASKDGTYIYVEKEASRQPNPRFFQLGNYYSAFSGNALSSNPLLVRNPFH